MPASIADFAYVSSWGPSEMTYYVHRKRKLAWEAELLNEQSKK